MLALASLAVLPYPVRFALPSALPLLALPPLLPLLPPFSCGPFLLPLLQPEVRSWPCRPAGLLHSMPRPMPGVGLAAERAAVRCQPAGLLQCQVRCLGGGMAAEGCADL